MGYVNKTYLSTQFKNFADKIAKVFSKIGHTHLKSDITDFPTSMPANGGNAATVGGHTVGVNVPSNAKFTDTTYSKLSEFTDDVGYVKNTDARLTDARNAKDVYDWAKASTKPTYTKSEIGLGNVDNTADSAKTVYAAQRMIIQENRIDGNLESFEFNPEYSREHLGTSSFDIVGYDKENKVMTYGNSIDAIDTRYASTTFKSNDSTTGDSTPPSLLASGETHASIFSKVSTIFKNVRWLLSKMGTTDISSIGNGTVTGALSTLNSNMVKTYTKDIIATVDTKWGNVYIAEGIMIDIPNMELTKAKGVQLSVNSKMAGSVFASLNSLTETQANIILLRGTSGNVNCRLYLTLTF